jgi:flagellar P-ring protein precursor FlgI
MDERNMLVTLVNPDYTTAYRLATAINETFDTDVALAQDAGSVIIDVPESYSTRNDMVRFIAEIEAVSFVPDERARVIINERTGTIIAGGNVSLGTVAITHGDLSLRIEQPGIAAAPAAQPAMPGQVPVSDRMVTISETANVNEVARALNMMGVTPNDLIAIFQALKRAGSLRAELLIM